MVEADFYSPPLFSRSHGGTKAPEAITAMALLVPCAIRKSSDEERYLQLCCGSQRQQPCDLRQGHSHTERIDYQTVIGI